MASLFFLWLLAASYLTRSYGDKCTPQCVEGEMLWFKNDHPIFEYNGCGLDYLSITSDVLDPCCMDHDACFKICGTDVNVCDERFRVCVDKACQTGFNMHKDACKFKSTVTHAILNAISCDFHYKNQEEYCKCLPMKAAKTKLRTNIKWFYERVNKGKLINTKEKLRKRFQHLSTKTDSGNWKAVNWLLKLLEEHPFKLTYYNGKSTLDTIKKGWDKIKTIVQMGWRSMTRHVKTGWNTTKTHVKNGVAALKKKVKSGWNSIKKGWNSLFGAHDDLYDEYKEFEGTDAEEENIEVKSENMKAFTIDDVGEEDELFALMLMTLFIVVISCGCIGCVCGFVVASTSTKLRVHFP